MPPYEQLPPDRISRVALGFKDPEAVAFDQNAVLYGSSSDGVIRRMTPDGTVSEFVHVGGRPCGLAFDREDNLFVCEAISGVVLKVSRTGTVSSFCERVGDLRLRVPNFLTFDAEGNLYVSNSSDRSIAQEHAEGMKPHPRGALVRLTPDGRGEVIATGLYLANGTAIDPAEEYVYVLQSTLDNCVRIPINRDGPAEAEQYGGDLGALADGMAFDADGYLIVTVPNANQLVVIDPDGTVSMLVDDPEKDWMGRPSNCAFGGDANDELFIGQIGADFVGRLPLGRKGHVLFNLR